MGKIIEYTLVSVDGVYTDPAGLGFMRFRDDAYLRDGLGVLLASEAMLMGRRFYEGSAKMWQSRPDHPWAHRINTMAKYVFSSTLKTNEWDNSTIIGGDVAAGAARLKETTSGDLLIWGHTSLAEALMRRGLVDVIDLSVHPLLAGHGGLLLREGLDVPLRLVLIEAGRRRAGWSLDGGPALPGRVNAITRPGEAGVDAVGLIGPGQPGQRCPLTEGQGAAARRRCAAVLEARPVSGARLPYCWAARRAAVSSIGCW